MPGVLKRLLFGTAGVPDSAATPSTIAGIERAADLGLECLEVEFVNGVNMSQATAIEVRRTAERRGIRLSAHAPYFINFNSPDPGKRMQSQERLLKTARRAADCGAGPVVFHAGYYLGGPPEAAAAAIKKELAAVASIVRQERLPVSLRIETMGKRSQFGSLDEVLAICRDIEGVEPCLDFAHIYAREGRVNSYEEFERVLAKVAKKLGPGSLKRVHIHIAGILFNGSGEIKHLNLAETDFRYDEWLEVLLASGAAGMVVCESPDQEQDAVILKTAYDSIAAKQSDARPPSGKVDGART